MAPTHAPTQMPVLVKPSRNRSTHAHNLLFFESDSPRTAMLHRNSSQALLGSQLLKEKKLPPVPLPTAGAADEILAAKTLRRKNFKQLLINLSPEKTTGPLAATEQAPLINYDVLSLRSRRQRPPPTLNLRQRGVNSPTSAPLPQLAIRPQVVLRNLSELSSRLLALLVSDNRRKQTVISLISPKKLTLLSPMDPGTPGALLAVTPQILGSSSGPQLTLQALALLSLVLELTMLLPLATKLLFQIENNDDLMFLKDLGLGNLGTVSKIVHLPTQTTMAKKIIPIDPNTVVQTQIIRELRILHECHLPYIIEFYGAFVARNTIVICMEYCNCGLLDKILPLCTPRQFPCPVLRKLAYAMLLGLEYLYTAHKIIHRDIKPLNVLMTHRGEFKLCDFGVLRELTNLLAQADTFVGTLMYMLPERIQGLKYGVKLDVWLMGLMLIELALGAPVWRDDDDENPAAGPNGILDLLQRIVNETPPLLAGKTNPVTGRPYPADLCAFIDLAMAKDESQRKSPRELLADEEGFLKGVTAGVYDRDVKTWAKAIRKLHIQKAK